MTEEEVELVRRCLRGEAGAIQSLVEAFQAPVYGLCLRMLHHRHDAEDVTQEVFVRIFRSLHRWDPARPLKPWILTITVNRCRTWLSQRSRRPDLVDYLHETVADERAGSSGGTGDASDAAELLVEVQAALDGLRSEYRSVFVLYHEQGQPYEAIAVTLGRPVGTIKTWLHRARQEILSRLRQRGMVSELTEPK